ncbi:MAG: hypothetical protein D6692_14525 [Planctomycetota bacterium]|nr:MAG: hypothetical protein D6692_14525 [Planctomycetota bacterium]
MSVPLRSAADGSVGAEPPGPVAPPDPAGRIANHTIATSAASTTNGNAARAGPRRFRLEVTAPPRTIERVD